MFRQAGLEMKTYPENMWEHGAWNEVRAVRAKEFDIRTRNPKPVNADGEIVTQTPAHFSIKPAAVTVFAPKPAGG